MNKESEKSKINSSEETKEVGVQVKEDENKSNLERVDTLIDLNITENYQESSDSDRIKYFKAFKNNELLNTTIKEGSPVVRETRVIGTRTKEGIIHVELPTPTRKSRVKTSELKMDFDKAIAMIPICTGANNVAEFINSCDIAVKSVEKDKLELLIKIINSKLAGNALQACKFRETNTWEGIKSILKGAFEYKASERTLTLGLQFARMKDNECVAEYASRIEELYYKLCTLASEKLSEIEAKVYKGQLKNQALIIFVNGLPTHLNLALKARDPKTLEEAMQVAKDEETEYNANLDVEKLRKNLERQSLNGRNVLEREIAPQNINNNRMGFNNGKNRFNNQNGGLNNFNGRNNNNGYNTFNKNFNQNGYNNNGRQNYNNINRNNNQNRMTPNTGCFICGRTNHFARDCRQRLMNQGQNFNVNRQQNSNNNNNNNIRRINNNVVNEGSLHCTYCNRRGHDINNCFTKQRNERNNTNLSGNGIVPNLSGVRLVHQIIDAESPLENVSMSQQL